MIVKLEIHNVRWLLRSSGTPSAVEGSKVGVYGLVSRLSLRTAPVPRVARKVSTLVALLLQNLLLVVLRYFTEMAPFPAEIRKVCIIESSPILCQIEVNLVLLVHHRRLFDLEEAILSLPHGIRSLVVVNEPSSIVALGVHWRTYPLSIIAHYILLLVHVVLNLV